MIKLGLVGALKTHAYVFSAIFNGGEEKKWPDNAWKPEKMAGIFMAGKILIICS